MKNIKMARKIDIEEMNNIKISNKMDLDEIGIKFSNKMTTMNFMINQVRIGKGQFEFEYNAIGKRYNIFIPKISSVN